MLSYDTKVISRVHPVHVMNVELCEVDTDPQTKLTDLGCKSVCRLLLSTSNNVMYYYSAQKLTLIVPSYGG